MDQQDWLTERFEENRPRLRGVAYRMLGSLSEAEDAVQEAWLRLLQSRSFRRFGAPLRAQGQLRLHHRRSWSAPSHHRRT